MDNKISYTYNGWTAYGAGELFCIDQFLDYDFCGNAVEQLLSQGATFEQISADRCVLKYKTLEAVFVRGE